MVLLLLLRLLLLPLLLLPLLLQGAGCQPGDAATASTSCASLAQPRCAGPTVLRSQHPGTPLLCATCATPHTQQAYDTTFAPLPTPQATASRMARLEPRRAGATAEGPKRQSASVLIQRQVRGQAPLECVATGHLDEVQELLHGGTKQVSGEGARLLPPAAAE